VGSPGLIASPPPLAYMGMQGIVGTTVAELEGLGVEAWLEKQEERACWRT
jgi:hypothetical protein